MAKVWAKRFYRSKAWRDTRQLVLYRDMYTCQECLSARAEEVHHIIELTPDNINDPNISLNPDNLVSLCHDCHTRITQGYTGDVVEGYYFDENGMVVKIGDRESEWRH